MSNYIELEKNFNLAETLDCGQAFRWKQLDDNVWGGIAYKKPLRIEEKKNSFLLDCSEEDFNTIWKNYFDLDTDYVEIKKRLSHLSPVLKEASEFAPGIRILRQEPWEAICSFIISQNNNIPRIKGIVERLCELLGEETSLGYTFPSYTQISSLTDDDLAPIRSGFRAKYIISAANTLNSQPSFTNDIFKGDVEEGRKLLMTIKGIGPKVADCALLYGFHKTSCFPLDVWMKRAMAVLLPNTDPNEFGEDAGIAQQYIFHYSRMHPELFKTEGKD